jgi:hypothetical protein
MNTSGSSLIVAGLVGVGLMAGYGYAKQTQVDALEQALIATQDSITLLWNKTREFAHTWAHDSIPITRPIRPTGVKSPSSPHGPNPSPPDVTSDDTSLRAPAVLYDTVIKPPVCPGPTCPKYSFAESFPLAPRWLRPILTH